MTAQIFNLGKLRFTYKGTYSGATEYQLNDVVKYTNNLYVYINTGATTGNAPTNTSYWSKMIDGYTDPTSGTNGQFLQTTGSAFQFASVSQVPSQTGNSGKFLKTDGTNASWDTEFPTLNLTGDGTVGSVSGVLYVGAEAENDNNNLGANVKNVSFKSLTNNVVTLTTSAAHGFSPFQYITVALSPSDPVFDGTYEIIDTPALNTLTYEKTASNVTNSATVGTVSAVTGYTNAAAVFYIDKNDDFAQIAFRNAGDGIASSTDIIVYPDNGTDFSGWFSHGVTSSNFADPEFTLTGINDAYLFYDAPFGTTGAGNLVIATGNKGTENKIVFGAGGLSSDNAQMTITPDVNVHIEIPTPSTSSTTGALTVVGGVGIQGNMNIQGSVSIVGNLTFGGGSTTTENLAVTAPFIFSGDLNTADLLDLGFIGEYATAASPIVATVTNKALTSNIATLTTNSNHTYLVGDVVTITGVDATFNGTYNVKTVPTSTTFTYAKTASNVTSTAVSPTGTATVNARRKFYGVVRDASDGIIKVFKDATTKPVSTVNFSEAGLAYGDIRLNNITAGGNVTIIGGATISGTTDVQEIREQLNAVSPVSNILTADWTTGNIFYVNQPSADFTLALTNVPTDNDKVMTVNVFINQAATGRIPTAITINGVSQTLRWASGSAPSPTSVINKIDNVAFTLIRQGSAWTVLAGINGNY